MDRIELNYVISDLRELRNTASTRPRNFHHSVLLLIARSIIVVAGELRAIREMMEDTSPRHWTERLTK